MSEQLSERDLVDEAMARVEAVEVVVDDALERVALALAVRGGEKRRGGAGGGLELRVALGGLLEH